MTEDIVAALGEHGTARRDPLAGVRRSASPRIGLAVVLWLALAFVVFLNKVGRLTPDIKPEVYLAPAATARNLLSSWYEGQQLGLPNFNVGLAPVAAFVALLQSLGLSPELSMRVLRLLLLTLAGWGAARLYREIGPATRNAAGRLAAAVAFVANPYVLVAGDTLAIVLPLAFLPWQVLFFVRALRDRRGWRWPAAFALTFVPMSGMNAGVVPLMQLLYVPAVVWFVLRSARLRLRAFVAPLARCAVLALAVSAYWLVPAVTARSVGDNVVNNSETLVGIAGPSSFAEVLRGLGLWVMYGGGPDGPWQPGFTPFLTNPLVVTASFALPALFAASALVVRGHVRRLAILLVVLAAVVMVGIHPPSHPSPVGAGMRWLFMHVTAAAAFRTTNKAGAVLVLGMSLLVGAGAAAVIRRRPRPRAVVAGGAALAVVLVVSVWPAFDGGMYSDSLTIPAYWRQAAAAVDEGSAQQRVWLVPGEVRSHYRWSGERVDDIDKSLLSRPSLVQYTIPAASAESANYLTAVDTLLQEGALPSGALSAAARYLGVSDLLERNDLVWEQSSGARPAAVQAQVGADSGLLPAGVFGDPGQNTVSQSVPPLSSFEAALPPVQWYRTSDPRSMLRVEPLAGGVLVDGDGWAFAPLVAAGLLERQPVFRYLGQTDVAQLEQALWAGTRLAITDTNRRRTSLTDRLANSQGPLLAANQDTGPSRTLFDDPTSQTVLRVEGGRVTATSSGSVFGTLPYASPDNAFDGDERTAWMFGDFGNAAGQTIRLRTDAPTIVDRVHLVMRPVGPVTISRVRLSVGDWSSDLAVPASGTLDVAVPMRTTTSVALTVLGTAGTGINLVGVNEIGIPGVRVTRVAALPTRLTRLTQQFDSTAQAMLAQTPVDVVLSRVRGTQAAGDDEETGLNRDFTLPQARTMRVYGLIRPDPAAADSRVDALLGVGGVVADSSSRLFDDPDVRASFTVDGNGYTGWSPAGPVVGQWISLTAQPQHVDHVDVTQPLASPEGPPSFVSRARIYLDSHLVADAALQPGLTRVRVPSQFARQLRLEITAVSGSGIVQISEIGFGTARSHKDPSLAETGCTPVAELDGHPLLMRPVQPLSSVDPAVWTGCGSPLTLAAGPHRLRALHAWVPDELVLRDLLGELPTAGPAVLPAQTERLSATHWRVTATLPPGPQVVVLGQNADPGWIATLDGRPLGPSVVADGYSAAWIVTAPGRHTVDIVYAPQRAATVAAVVSGSVLGLCVVLALWRGTRPMQPSAPTPDTARRGAPQGARRHWVTAGGWLGAVALAWVLGGPPAALVGAAIAVWHAVRAPEPRRLIQLAVGALAACPLAFLVGNAERWGDVSPALVLRNEAPHALAAAGLVLLVVGVWRDDAMRHSSG